MNFIPYYRILRKAIKSKLNWFYHKFANAKQFIIHTLKDKINHIIFS